MNKQQEELVTQSYLLENGWTKSMIQKFLPDPVLKKNPRYSSAPPMKLWKKEIIEQTMQTDTFLSYIQKTETRKKAAHKAVQTKKEQLMTETESLLTALTVTVLPETILKQKVIEDKKQWADLHDDIFTEPANSETMERWTVNYIRHHLIEYDSNLRKLKGKTGKRNAYVFLKKEILSKIAETYPLHAAECERQKQELDKIIAT